MNNSSQNAAAKKKSQEIVDQSKKIMDSIELLVVPWQIIELREKGREKRDEHDGYAQKVKAFEEKIKKEANAAKGFFGSYAKEERKIREKYKAERE